MTRRLPPGWAQFFSCARCCSWQIRWAGVLAPECLQRTLDQPLGRTSLLTDQSPFIHHLAGGFGKDARGGAEAAGLYEWGGHNPDGTDVFREKRPGWPLPIHDLLVRKGVSVVFHGHDHLYARQDLDGIVYQAVPQPRSPR